MLPASCSHDVSSATPVTAAAARLPSQAANHAVGHVVVHALLAFAFCIGLATNTLAQASRNGMVVAQETRAARVGVEILEKGGNAGDADPRKSRDSALSIGVPGTVAGLALAHQRFGSGRLTLAELMAPAIRMARDGIPIEDDIADTLPRAETRIGRWPSAAKIFLKPDLTALAPGDLMVQKDLAATLEAIAQHGPRAFYDGPIAEKLAAGIQAAGGIMTAQDLRDYRPILRRPVRGTYRGHRIVSMPPSSSGGVVL